MVREEPYQGLKRQRMPKETLAVRKDAGAGGARLSSARVLKCSLKWGNERNPRPVL